MERYNFFLIKSLVILNVSTKAMAMAIDPFIGSYRSILRQIPRQTPKALPIKPSHATPSACNVCAAGCGAPPPIKTSGIISFRHQPHCSYSDSRPRKLHKKGEMADQQNLAFKAGQAAGHTQVRHSKVL